MSARRLEDAGPLSPREFRELLKRFDPEMLRRMGEHYEVAYEVRYGLKKGRGSDVRLSGHSDPTGEQAVELSRALERTVRLMTDASEATLGADSALSGVADWVGSYRYAVRGYRRRPRGPRLKGQS